MSHFNARGWTWTVVDSWALVKGDATANAVEGIRREMMQSHRRAPGLSVRSYKRTVRAGGAVVPLTVIVARSKTAECTCRAQRDPVTKRPTGARHHSVDRDCSWCVEHQHFFNPERIGGHHAI